ncbi:hypothetical protein FBEOM_2558 [Fusarium beomiforme]|uniref:Mtf2-like C-terminal domain-containing protein n=1 Tax=Fusarium beomiforme TaxID=44412 RepID=A0A9P5ARX4_9HYPO|nr:hypothetical protein FBEOM_2558 [Fusarium beomiforme]
MSRNILPFLYQTRTLQLTCRRPASIFFTQRATLATSTRRLRKRSGSDIPFEFDDEEIANTPETEIERQGTLTPTETEIFKGIFDDISQGRLAKNKKSPQFGQTQPADSPLNPNQQVERHGGNTLVEKAHNSSFSGEFLRRYPASLRKAAENALGKFELAPKRTNLYSLDELDQAEKKQMREWGKYEAIRGKEKERVQGLMNACQTDIELWNVMEEEVFSLPEKLGIVEKKEPVRRGRKPKAAAAEEAANNLKAKKMNQDAEKPVMDIHGHLYSHYLNYGLHLFDTAFARSSILAFNILPRVKELGLSSYVLGVSTPFFIKLAEMHWKRYGDATSAFDALDEMKPVGLFPNEQLGDLEGLVQQIEDHLHSCTWGAQGPFVMAMMQGPPYDQTLMSRLGRMKGLIAKKHFYNERDGRSEDRAEY